jgi:lysophospholipase L1-like esterase
MGTNEAYGPNFSSAVFYNEIDRLVQSLKKRSPNALFLLTTPAETWKKTRKQKRKTLVPNPTIEAVRNTIVKYATDHQMAYWDLFTITGGKGSARDWSKNNLFAKDGVHFTRDGYEYQGELLFQALYKSFTSFINETEK